MNDEHDLEVIVKSKVPIIVIEAREEKRVLDLLGRIGLRAQINVFTWSVADGMRQNSWKGERLPETHDPEKMLRNVWQTLSGGLYVLMDFQPYFTNPVITRLVKEIALGYGRAARTLVFVGHKIEPPPELARLSARFELAIPDVNALKQLVQDEAKRWETNNGEKVKAQREAFDTLVQHLAGLCEEDARRLTREAMADGALTMDDLPRLHRAKHGMLGGSELVQIELNTAKFSDVGGLKNLKRWLEQRRAVFLGAPNPALESPKGILIVGVQGGGKSLAAKAVAGAWALPLLRLDFGTLYNKYYGETERNVREALKLAEAMAPCVLWIDEVEKGLAQDGNDDGVSRRVLGTLLTWMAERTARVFLAVTANDISALPPELIRKGRMDEIFFVDLPDAEAKREIFTIHLTRRKLDPAAFDLDQLVTAADGFSGAEIEQAIVASFYEAHGRSETLATAHVLAEIARTRPLSVVMAEKIAALRAWSEGRTVMAN